MEPSSLQWEDMDRIDRIRRAHAQKHVVGRGNWAKPSDLGRKPWFCKSYQTSVCTHNRDHESNGKLQKHICAYCLMGGRQLAHPEKDCNFKKQSAKNEQSVSGESAADSSQNTVGTKKVNSGLGGSNNAIIPEENAHGGSGYVTRFFYNSGPRWQSGNTLASHLCGRGSIPVMAVSGKAGSCLPLVGSLQYTTLANSMYWFPLPFQLPVVI